MANPLLLSNATTDIEVDLQRRNLLRLGAGAGIVVLSAGFTQPQCGVSKEKAERYVKLIIDLAKEAPPLLNLLGAKDIAVTVEAKVIPALEKLRDALAETDIPDAASLLENVRNVLGIVASGLMNLPDSPRRTTLIGILTSVRVLLLTVEAFIDSEMPATTVAGVITGDRRAAMTSAIKKAAEAVKETTQHDRLMQNYDIMRRLPEHNFAKDHTFEEWAEMQQTIQSLTQ